MFRQALFSLLPFLSLVAAANVAYTKVSIKSSNVPRYYLVTVPPGFNANTPTPVIFSFHGKTKTAEDQYELTLLSDPFFNDYAIAVYPNGLNVRSSPPPPPRKKPTWRERMLISFKHSWQGHPEATSNDKQFTLDILTSLKSRYTLDNSRIYASGKSLGGGFVGTLACDKTLSNKFAAFAPVAGAFYIKNDTACAPRTIHIPCDPGRVNIPIIEFHGEADDTIDYSGAVRSGQCVPWIPHWVRQWANRDGLEFPGNVSSAVTDDTTLYQFEDAQGGQLGLVSHVYDVNLGHSWPSTVSHARGYRAVLTPCRIATRITRRTAMGRPRSMLRR